MAISIKGMEETFKGIEKIFKDIEIVAPYKFY